MAIRIFLLCVVHCLTDVLMPAAATAVVLVVLNCGYVLARRVPVVMVLVVVLVLVMAMLGKGIVVGCSLHAVVYTDAAAVGCHETVRHR